ncbi:hypothetical protein [Klebsiella pneumoniae]|uniref:hypothetical protein n=1 Tax=Klebsiella pneumoniae TaxID=573 RepID=UPI002739B3BE|nr:hypothetical protein [Klebsiella pneumoniae]
MSEHLTEEITENKESTGLVYANDRPFYFQFVSYHLDAEAHKDYISYCTRNNECSIIVHKFSKKLGEIPRCDIQFSRERSRAGSKRPPN